MPLEKHFWGLFLHLKLFPFDHWNVIKLSSHIEFYASCQQNASSALPYLITWKKTILCISFMIRQHDINLNLNWNVRNKVNFQTCSVQYPLLCRWPLGSQTNKVSNSGQLIKIYIHKNRVMVHLIWTVSLIKLIMTNKIIKP